MRTIRYSGVCAAMAAAAMILAGAARARAAENDKQATAAERENKGIAVLQSDAPPQEKAITCKRLAIYGTEKAVPALAPLLADEKLAAWARTALEVIPGPAADAALREAAGKLQGRLLIGVITSIGVRRDAQAVDRLASRLNEADVDVASAAAAALGRIGGNRAQTALHPSLQAGAAGLRNAAAEGCILCAERALTDGNAADALMLYDAVRKADVPKQRILEATRGAILVRRAAGAPLLVEQLKSADAGRFALGLRTARELPDREVTGALIAQLNQAPPDRRKLLILALADRGDGAALPAVLQEAERGPVESRVAAIRVLRRLGDASCMPVLLDAAMDSRKELANAAADVLCDLPGKNVDDALVAGLAKSEGPLRQVLIQLAGRRNIAAAVPALLAATEDRDSRIRSAAFEALGYSAQFRDLPVLIARVASPSKDPEEKKAAEQALRAACERMPDREACAEKLVVAMRDAPVSARCRILEILAAIGGTKALEAVAGAAKAADGDLRETGSRLLGAWMSVDAGPVLLDLAKTATDAKYETRAVRGYIRLARQFVMPAPQRAEMCRNAMAVAGRDAEKKLVLDVLARYPSLDALQIAVEAAKTPSLKSAAAQTSLIIAQKLGGNSADVVKLLAQVGHDPVKIEILKAEYGAGSQTKDATETLRSCVRGMPLIVLPSPDYNSSFGGDPAPNIVKQLKIRYRLNGKSGEATFVENAAIMLPTPR